MVKLKELLLSVKKSKNILSQALQIAGSEKDILKSEIDRADRASIINDMNSKNVISDLNEIKGFLQQVKIELDGGQKELFCFEDDKI